MDVTHAEHFKNRFHDAIHRAPKKQLSTRELEEVNLAMTAVVAEVAAEIAVVVADLAARVESLEKAAKPS
jgi:hypothetical protein